MLKELGKYIADYSDQLTQDNTIDWQALERELLEYVVTKDIPVRHPSVVDLEKKLYFGQSYHQTGEVKGLVGWSQKHDSEYEDMGAIPYNPADPLHRIETVETEAAWLPLFIPRFILVPAMRYIYLKTLGERGANALAAYDQTPAHENRTLEEVGSVAEEIGRIVLRKETVVDATAHAESLEDVATYGGLNAISAARKRSRFVRRCGFSLSKTLVLEEYKGKPVLKRIKFFGKNYLTIPESDNLALFDLPDDGVYKIRFNVSRAIAEDRDGKLEPSVKARALNLAPGWLKKIGNYSKSEKKPNTIQKRKKGMVFTVAPAGRAAVRNPGKDNSGRQKEGPQSLHQSAMSMTTANMLSKFDHFFVTSEWDSRVAVSSIYKLANLKVLKQQERKETIVSNANRIQQMLAEQTASLAQRPVTYELINDDGESVTKKTMLPSMPT